MSAHAGPASDPEDRSVDPLITAAIALAVFAAGCWAAAIVTHVAQRRAGNSGAVVLAAGWAAVVTLCAVICWCAAAVRHHDRRMANLVCRKIDDVVDVHVVRRAEPNGHRSDADVEWRAYLAGRIDRDDE